MYSLIYFLSLSLSLSPTFSTETSISSGFSSVAQSQLTTFVSLSLSFSPPLSHSLTHKHGCTHTHTHAHAFFLSPKLSFTIFKPPTQALLSQILPLSLVGFLLSLSHGHASSTDTHTHIMSLSFSLSLSTHAHCPANLAPSNDAWRLFKAFIMHLHFGFVQCETNNKPTWPTIWSTRIEENENGIQEWQWEQILRFF